MGYWFWFSLWAALIVGAIATFTYIGLSLRESANKLRPEIEIALKRAQDLAALRESASGYVGPKPDVDPVIAIQKRRGILRARELKRQVRERRLVEHLKHIEIDESRFS